MSDDFFKVVVEPRAGMSKDWQTYRPKPTASTVKARRMANGFTVDGQELAGNAGDFLIDSDGGLSVMTAEQFHEAFSAVRGPRPKAPAAAAEGE